MKLNKFFVVILPMFIFLVFLVSHTAFAQNETQKINVYEGLGLKIKYFDPWKIGDKEDEPSCVDQCFIMLDIPDLYASIFIRQDKFDSSVITNECKCDTLLEYAKYKYENTLIKAYEEDLVFINDNQTTISYGKIPAIQLEYEISFTLIGSESGRKHLTIYTKSNNSFYDISVGDTTDKSKSYPKYLGDFKKILNSLEFVSANMSKPKQPSFMMDTNESNNTSPIQNLTNENILDGKEQLSESSESNNKVDITSYNSYINSIGHLHVIGEVENNSPVIAEFVKIIGTFYDDNGNVVGTSFTYSNPTDIGSGEKAPFDLILSDSTIPVEQIKEYRLTISYR
jgi:hypothetical protein